jgi:hypothetical protein
LALKATKPVVSRAAANTIESFVRISSFEFSVKPQRGDFVLMQLKSTKKIMPPPIADAFMQMSEMGPSRRFRHVRVMSG